MKPIIDDTKTRQPWVYVPTLYFAEGLPYVLVNTISVIMYKNLGFSNTLIGFTSLLYLPWVVKPLWAPIVDVVWTKRKWIIRAQLGMAALIMLLALALHAPAAYLWTMAVFVGIAFISATHDIATDGFYIIALNPAKQAFYVGVRSTFYRISMIFGSGVLVVLAGGLYDMLGSYTQSWMLIMLLAGAILLALSMFHEYYLPGKTGRLEAEKDTPNIAAMLEIFAEFFRRPRIGVIISFMLLYRLGEAMLVKMAAPFLLDDPVKGGLGLSTQTVGYAYGTVGVISLVVGGLLGGWLIAEYGLRKTIWPMALALNLPDLVYVYMASGTPPESFVYGLIAVEQFGYGVGFAAYMVFLLYIAAGEHETSHFALATGFMALGMMLPGMLSGIIEEAFGYQTFFIIVCILTLPGMLLIPFIPKEPPPEKIAA